MADSAGLTTAENVQYDLIMNVSLMVLTVGNALIGKKNSVTRSGTIGPIAVAEIRCGDWESNMADTRPDSLIKTKQN